jgi:hypothetical protein
MDIQEPDSIAALAKGIAVRAAILSVATVASVVVGAWIFIRAARRNLAPRRIRRFA